ncbi:MAG: hypothetical protein IJE25_03215 [Clostridia bacterium]|nr:hypothetical protein [Clostridia bacterium]
MNILPGKQFSVGELLSPSAEYAVTYMWFWNAPVTRERVDRELLEYKKAGIESIYIVPLSKDFNPEMMRSSLAPEYLTEEFFDIAEYTLRKCIELGIKPWIYDEGGWPSGGACYNTVRENPAAALKLIEKREVSLMADKRFIPEEGFIALFNKKHRLPDDYIASRDCTLTAYYCVKKVINGCRVDYTNRSVTETFINNTYEKYRERVGDLFGESIPVIFTDEPGLLSSALADNEFELFEKEFGYDLKDLAYVLTDNDGDLTEVERRALIDHNILLGKLFLENTFKPLHDWCEKHGIYYSGHLDIDNRPYGGTVKGVFSMLNALRQFHIPGVDVIWEQIRYPHGGRTPVDDETLGMGFFPRLAASAARQTGRNVTVSESLGIYGDGLDHDTIRFVMNYQYVRGINAMNFAPISFGNSRLLALATRPNFRPEKPGFYHLSEIHEYAKRMSYLTRLGYAEGEVALYIPCCDFSAGMQVLDRASASFKALGTYLEENNIPFDIIDDAGIRDATLTPEGLRLGDALYRYIAVPECRYMPEDVKEKCEKSLGMGTPVYKFKNKFLRVMTRRLDEGRLWFIFNEGAETVQEKLDISGGKNVYEIDPRSGEMYEAEGVPCTAVCGEIKVYLATDKKYPTVTRSTERCAEITDLKPVSYKKFVLDYKGIFNEYGEGAPEITPDFSGEITYEGSYTLPEAPKAGERYRIVCEGTATTVSLNFGGRVLALGMSPKEGIVDGSALEKDGKVRVTLANTAVNEIRAKQYIIDSMPKAERGTHYIPKLREFESRVPALSLGRIFIEKFV